LPSWWLLFVTGLWVPLLIARLWTPLILWWWLAIIHVVWVIVNIDGPLVPDDVVGHIDTHVPKIGAVRLEEIEFPNLKIMILGGFSKENPERAAAEDQGQEVEDAAVEPPGNTVLVRADSRDLALKTRNNQVDFLVNKLVSEPILLDKISSEIIKFIESKVVSRCDQLPHVNCHDWVAC